MLLIYQIHSRAMRPKGLPLSGNNRGRHRVEPPRLNNRHQSWLRPGADNPICQNHRNSVTLRSFPSDWKSRLANVRNSNLGHCRAHNATDRRVHGTELKFQCNRCRFRPSGPESEDYAFAVTLQPGAVSRGGTGVGFGDGAIDCHRDGGNCGYGYLWNNANFERPAKFDGHVRLEHAPSRRFGQWRKFELFGFDWHNRQSIFRKSPRAVCVSRFSAHLWPTNSGPRSLLASQIAPPCCVPPLPSAPESSLRQSESPGSTSSPPAPPAVPLTPPPRPTSLPPRFARLPPWLAPSSLLSTLPLQMSHVINDLC